MGENRKHTRLGWWLAGTPALVLLVCAPTHLTRFHLVKVALAATLVLGGLVWLQPSLPRGRVTTLALAFFAWAALSITWSPAPGRGLQTWVVWVVGALYGVLLAQWLRAADPTADPTGRLARLWLWAGMAAALLALIQRTWGWRLGLHQVTGPVGNPNTLAVALVACLPAGWLLLVSPRDGSTRERVLGGVGLALLLVGIWATRCHAAWLAVAAMLVLEEITAPISWGRRVVFGVLLGAAVIAVLAGGLPADVRASLEGRWLLAQISAQVVRAAPVHGVGLGGYAHHAAWGQGAQLAGGSGPWSPLRDAHNQGLQVAAELGLVGLALSITLLAALLWPVWRRGSEPSARAALLAWAGLLLFCLSETALQRVEVLLPAVGWLAVGRGLVLERNVPSETEGATSGQRWIPTGLLVIGAVATFLAVGDLRADLLHARGLARLGAIAHRAPLDDELRTVDRDYTAALASALDPADLLMARAIVRRARGQDAAALKDARAAFRGLPSPARALLVGDLESARGRPAAARWWFEIAVALHPRYARGYNNLGVALIRLDERGLGCDTLRRAVSLRPSDPTIRENWLTLCHLYHRPPTTANPRNPTRVDSKSSHYSHG